MKLFKNGFDIKRMIPALLALMMIFVLSACGGKTGGEKADNEEVKTEAVENEAAKEVNYGEPEYVAKAYFAAEKAGDIDTIYALTPAEVTEYIVNNNFEGNKEELINVISENSLASYLKEQKLRDDDCEIEFLSVRDSDEDYITEAKDIFAEKGIGEITDIKDAVFKLRIGDNTQDEFIVTVIQMGGKWSVLPYYISDIIVE